MFLILSKLLVFALNPLFWVVCLIFIGILFKNPVKKHKYLTASFIVVMVFLNSVLYSEFARNWEIKGKLNEEISCFDYAIVLGGMGEYSKDYKRISVGRQFDRLWQVVKLYKEKKVRKIVLSGGSGHLIDTGLKEALQFKGDLMKLDVDANDIIVESKSRNTKENAEFCFDVLHRRNKKISQSKVLLSTSAMHMKRAEACFKKAGFKTVSFAVDHQTGRNRNYTLEEILIPNSKILFNWNGLFKEYVGFLIYKLMGYL